MVCKIACKLSIIILHIPLKINNKKNDGLFYLII